MGHSPVVELKFVKELSLPGEVRGAEVLTAPLSATHAQPSPNDLCPMGTTPQLQCPSSGCPGAVSTHRL